MNDKEVLYNDCTQKKGIILMVVSAFCACIGQLFWKIGTSWGILFILGGFAFYGVGAIIMIIAYRYGKLSTLQPIQSINYIISIFLGALIFNEKIIIGKVIGIVCIFLGVFLCTRGDKE